MPKIEDVREAGPVPVPFSRRFKMRSHLANADFVIDVAVPPPYPAGEGAWPVLFVTDGNLAFPTAASTAAILPIEPGGPRPICVVGIGYDLARSGEKGEQFALRSRDLTPMRDKGWEERMRAAPLPFRLEPTLETGGGEHFLDFIIEELRPWIVETFPVDAANCTLAGNSFGATLALHAMLTRPGAFAGYLAVSPALWWADEHVVRLERAHAEAYCDLETRLYLAIGGAEEAQAPEARMVSRFLEFAGPLERRAYPSLQMKHEILSDETHVSVFNAAISNGIRYLFGAISWSDSTPTT